MIPPTFWVLLALGLQQVSVSSACEAYVYKSHSWSKGYVAKLYVDQNQLQGTTSKWDLDITFNNEVKEFKIWDADIQGTTKNYVNNVSQVVVENKCYNPILYSCQFLELSFLVRFPDDVSDESSTDYDIKTLVESVELSDGVLQTNNFNTICEGQPTSAPAATTVAG